MMNTLRGLGFQVFHGFNLNEQDTVRRIDEFGQKAADADVAVVFYAGHGMQWRGKNYLVTIDGQLPTGHATDASGIGKEVIQGGLNFEEHVLKRARTHKKGGVNIVFLDACRDDPWSKVAGVPVHGLPGAAPDRSLAAPRPKSDVGLLGLMEARQTYIAYATQPGDVAEDGGADHSPFTAALLKHIVSPGEEFHAVMQKVVSEVLSATGNRQHPSFTGTLPRQSFSLAPRSKSEVAKLEESSKSQPKNNPPLPVAPAKSPIAILPATEDRCEDHFHEANGSATPIAALANFLRACPSHVRVSEAAALRSKLLQSQSDIQACDRALKADTLVELQSYVDRFPKGNCAPKVADRIRSIQTPPVAMIVPRNIQPQALPPAPPPARFRCERNYSIAWLEERGAYGDQLLDPSAYAESISWTVNDGKSPTRQVTKSRWQIEEEDRNFKNAYSMRRYTIRSSSATLEFGRCDVELVLDYYRKRSNALPESGTVRVTFSITTTVEPPRIIAQRIVVLTRR